MTNEAAELLRREWGRGSELFDKQLEAALAAERSRLLSEAGEVPSKVDSEKYLKWKSEAATGHVEDFMEGGRAMYEWLHDTFASSLLSQQQRHDKEMKDFAEWQYTECAPVDGMQQPTWMHDGKLYEYDQLLARFREEGRNTKPRS